ncbi:hypothetical protein L208DRAFT_1395868 [Tricholoma matsutake]|nr:hypothetical protein L208DRAFT_1395868 [Tricholoma matsutake 945]
MTAASIIFLGQPARLSQSIPPNPEDTDTWAEVFWTSRSKEAKLMVQVIGVLLSAVVTRLYTSGGRWPLGDALLQLSFTILAISIVLQFLVMFYSKAMQIPGPHQCQWVEAAHARTLVAFASMNPWVVLSIPTVWTLWGILVVCVTILMLGWQPSDIPQSKAQSVNLSLAVSVTGVFTLGALCSLVLISTCHRWISYRRDNTRVNELELE